MIDSLKQFKLSNDDEIICEVVQWNDEDSDAIVVRGVLRVIHVEDYAKSVRFYAFRPWMMFHDNLEELHTMNASHIIAEVNPSEEITKHYFSTMREINKQIKNKKQSLPLDDVAKKMDEMDEDEFEDYIIQMLDDKDEHPDSDMPENVVKFKPRTVHQGYTPAPKAASLLYYIFSVWQRLNFQIK